MNTILSVFEFLLMCVLPEAVDTQDAGTAVVAVTMIT